MPLQDLVIQVLTHVSVEDPVGLGRFRVFLPLEQPKPQPHDPPFSGPDQRFGPSEPRGRVVNGLQEGKGLLGGETKVFHPDLHDLPLCP